MSMSKSKPGLKESDNETMSPQRRILIADDESDIRAVLRSLFEGEGYEVQEAGTGEEVLQILSGPEEERPDLALVDVRMPAHNAANGMESGEGGLQTLQRLHEQGLEV